jgi:D-alanine-D-alanine ligase
MTGASWSSAASKMCARSRSACWATTTRKPPFPARVEPSREFYSYESKYVDGTSGLLIPAPIPAETSELIRQIAVRAYKAIDCAGMARVDFLLDKDTGELYLNEVNTIPGFTKISMYPKLWKPAACLCGAAGSG